MNSSKGAYKEMKSMIFIGKSLVLFAKVLAMVVTKGNT